MVTIASLGQEPLDRANGRGPTQGDDSMEALDKHELHRYFQALSKPDPKPARVSLRDIAKRIGVSHVTVSLALRDHSRISLVVRQKIRQAAEEMGYRPDPMLSALANYRKGKSAAPITATIAWINAWDDPPALRSHKEFDLYWKGAAATAEKFGYRLEEFQLGGHSKPQRLHQILASRGIRGLLLPPQRPHPNWGDFPWGEYSVVRFGRSLQDPRTHLVTADQVANTVLDTTVDAGINQQPEEIGRVGFLMLNSLINDGARGVPKIFRQILVEGSWVDGASLPDRRLIG